MANLQAPSLSASLSTLADWMELLALGNPRRIAADADLIAIGQASEDETPTDAIDADADTEALLDDVFDELERRMSAAGPSYPFAVSARGTALEATGGAHTDSQCVYLFCLLVSEYRRQQLLPKAVFASHAAEVEDLFQVCSTVAAAGLVDGTAVSFGFPRPDGSGFLAALKRTYEDRFGEGRTELSPRPGVTSHAKDAGIDVIAWRSFPDGLPGKLYLLGQCASGLQYRGKSVRGYLGNFHGDWFTQQPASPPVEALFVPFMLDHDLSVRQSESRAQVRTGHYESLTRGLGVLVDRCRLSLLVERGLERASTQPADVGRVDEVGRVRAWVDAVVAGL